MAKLYKSGKAKAVGVSNYDTRHLEHLLDTSSLVPAVNQIEFHPFIYQKQAPILEFCQAHDIAVEAYSPLTMGHNLNHPTITAVAAKNGKSNAQVILRWCIQHQTVPIPKSTNPAHIKENLDIFSFELSDEDMKTLNALGNGSGWQPNTE
jgi:diketogulonate reductase-like aldo/keto reductase